jgi:predicted signal transduction protein with EAL and GGDEF domain
VTTTEHRLSEVLSEFASTMLTDFPIQGILDQLVCRIVEVMPITGAGVTLISDTTSPHYAAASDSSALQYEKLQTELNVGTGYSSLSYLRQFPFDMIKINQSFVADLVDQGASHAIVSKTIELAQLLDLLVVCEGVQTPEQYHQVSVLGSDYCQGYYFARPMTPDMLDDATSRSTSPWVIER